MLKLISKLFILLFFISFVSCRKDLGLSNYGNYPNEIGKIMVTQCATSGCHNDASYLATNGLNLSTWDQLFNGSNSGSTVIPFSSKFSSLCYFINTFPSLGPIVLPTMPINGVKLNQDEVRAIQNWIEQGAPDLNGKIKWSDNTNRKKMYVTNQGCDVVSVFDSETQLPIRMIEVGNDPNVIEVPHMVKVSPDNKFWYVIFTNNNIMQKYSCENDQLIATVNLGANFDWNTFTITDDGTKAYCVAWKSNGNIAAVDLTQMKLIRNYGGYSYPHGVALNLTNDTIYVTSQSSNFIYKLDTAFNNVYQISLNGLPPSTASSIDPHELLVIPSKNKMYITCQKTNDIRVFDFITNSIVSGPIPTGNYPSEMAYSSSLNKLFVTCMYDTLGNSKGSVTVINISNNSTQTIKVGALPHGIAIDENKKLTYVISRNILSNGPAPHHTAVCNGRNGFVSYIDNLTLLVKTRKTEISVDPYSAAFRN